MELTANEFFIVEERIDIDNISLDIDGEAFFIPLMAPWHDYIKGLNPELIDDIAIVWVSPKDTYISVTIGDEIITIGWEPTRSNINTIEKMLRGIR